MRTECPYCGAGMDVTRVERHVRLADDDAHGPHGAAPDEDMDNPWALRVAFDEPPADGGDGAVDPATVMADVRRGRCPACTRGVMALKGGDGFLSSGRRRMACPNCGWETPAWVRLE